MVWRGRCGREPTRNKNAPCLPNARSPAPAAGMSCAAPTNQATHTQHPSHLLPPCHAPSPLSIDTTPLPCWLTGWRVTPLGPLSPT